MIVNEKSFIRLMKKTLKVGLVVGFEERTDGGWYLFGGPDWAAAFHEDKIGKNILGDTMKLCGFIPKNQDIFTVFKDQICQYSIKDANMFTAIPALLKRVGVTELILYDNFRIISSPEGLKTVNDYFIQMIDMESVTDEETNITGPYYSVSEEAFTWFNDCSMLKVYYRRSEEDLKDLYLKELQTIRLQTSIRHTYHN